MFIASLECKADTIQRRAAPRRAGRFCALKAPLYPPSETAITKRLIAFQKPSICTFVQIATARMSAQRMRMAGMWRLIATKSSANEFPHRSVINAGQSDDRHPFNDEGERAMRSASVRVVIAISTALLALALVGSNVLAQTVTVSVSSPFSPNPIPVCGESQASVSATAIAPIPGYPCRPISAPTWSWAVNGPPGVTISGNGPTATVSADICSAGAYNIWVTARATWTDACNVTYSTSGSAPINTLNVVAVTAITPLSEVSQKNIGDTLTKADFTITTNPPGFENQEFVTVASVTIQIGDNVVTATCGCSTATTDVVGCVCSATLSDLIVGLSSSDDSMNFTALVQGCDGTYQLTGSDSSAVIDGGDTSGSLSKNVTHSGTIYISSTPPGSGSNVSRLPTFLNERLAYGLGGISDSTETRQVNGQYSGATKIVVRGLALAAVVVGAIAITDEVTLNWNKPIVIPTGTMPIETSTTNNQWNPITVKSSFLADALGWARWSGFGFKYTENPWELVAVDKPNPLTVMDPNNKPVSAWTYAEANLAGQPGTNKKAEQNQCGASDSAEGKTQIKKGTAGATLWVGTANQVDPAWTWSDNIIRVTFYSD